MWLLHCIYNKQYTCGNASFHCRHATVPKCGGSGPCLSGGELSGVCCQRELHVLCVRASTYTRVNRMCSFFSLSIAVSRWSVLQECAYVRMWGTMLYTAQVSTELVKRVTKVDSDFSTVPLSLPLPGFGYKRLVCHASRQLQHAFWSLLYSTIYF